LTTLTPQSSCLRKLPFSKTHHYPLQKQLLSKILVYPQTFYTDVNDFMCKN
jgi:hypothetical protein